MRPFPPFCPMAPTSRKSPSPPKNVLNAYKAGNGAGYVFQAQGKGLRGHDHRHGRHLLRRRHHRYPGHGARRDPPGIGDRIEKEAHFQEQYLGKDYNLEGIEFLSGATFSSKGFNAAVGNAFVAYGELAGIAIEAPTEEKGLSEAELIAEMLGEGYTELETAPEGTDSAYQSELGYAFNVHAAGFSGDLHILVAIDNNGAIIASKLYQHTETPNEYEELTVPSSPRALTARSGSASPLKPPIASCPWYLRQLIPPMATRKLLSWPLPPLRL